MRRLADANNRGPSDGDADGFGDADGPQENDTRNDETGGHIGGTTNDVGNGGARQPGSEGENEGARLPEATMGEEMNGDDQQGEPNEEEGNGGAGGPPEDRDSEELLLQETSSIADIDTALRFITLLRSATLQESATTITWMTSTTNPNPAPKVIPNSMWILIRQLSLIILYLPYSQRHEPP